MVAGERISITAPTKKEAEQQAAAVKAGAKIEHAPERMTLNQAIKEYITSKAAVLSPATIRGYRTTQKHRFAQLMQCDVHQITKAHVQRAVNQEAQLVSAKTVANAYGLIRPVLKECGIDVFGVRLPQVVKPVKQYLQPEDIGKLIQAIEGDSCEVPILLAVWLGMRRSEILGLCWDCVDLDRSLIHVRRTVVPDEDNHWVLKEVAKIHTVSAQWIVPTISWTRSGPCPAGKTGGFLASIRRPSASTSTGPVSGPGSPIPPSTACVTPMRP